MGRAEWWRSRRVVEDRPGRERGLHHIGLPWLCPGFSLYSVSSREDGSANKYSILKWIALDTHCYIWMDSHPGPSVQCRGVCLRLCGSLYGRGAWGRMNIWICMAESLWGPPETVTVLFIGQVVQSLGCVQLFATPWTAARQASMSFTISQSLPRFMFIARVMPSSHLILWCPFLLLPSIFPSIRDFSSLVQFSRSIMSDSLQSHDCCTSSLPVHHQLLEFTQTHVHWVSDVISPSHPLSPPSPPTFKLSQYQGLFQWVSSSHQVTKVL